MYVHVFWICLMGALVQASTGFGFGIAAMSVMPLFVPYTTCLATIGLVSGIQCIWIAVSYRKHIQWKTITPLAGGYFVFATLTNHLVMVQPSATMMRLLGGVLVLLSIYMIKFSKKLTVRPTLKAGIIAGALGGTGHAAFSIGGPPVVIYLLAATATPTAYLASINTYFAITSNYLNVVRIAQGVFTPSVLFCCVVGFAALPLGTMAGKRIVNRFSADNLRAAVYGFMCVMGVIMMFK